MKSEKENQAHETKIKQLLEELKLTRESEGDSGKQFGLLQHKYNDCLSKLEAERVKMMEFELK